MAFKLKYKNSAFPFKGSPVKELQTESGESVVEVDNEGSEVEQENIETAKKVIDHNRTPDGQVYGPGTRAFKRPEVEKPDLTDAERAEQNRLQVHGPGTIGFKRPESKTPRWTGWMSV